MQFRVGGAEARTYARSDHAVLELFCYFFRGEKSKIEFKIDVVLSTLVVF